MSASIVPFPAKYEQTAVDKLIRSYLAEMSSDPELIDAVAAKMNLYIDRFAGETFAPTFDLAVPTGISPAETQALLSSIEKGIDAAGRQYEKIICEIVIERLFLEVELFEHRKKGRRAHS